VTTRGHRRGVPALIGLATCVLVALLVVVVTALGRPASPAAGPEAADATFAGGAIPDTPSAPGDQSTDSALLLPVTSPPSGAPVPPPDGSALPLPGLNAPVAAVPSRPVPSLPVPPPRPTPPAVPKPRGPVLSGPAGQVVALTNAERAKHGCKPLKVDPRLVTSALRHSQDMANRGYFEHESPEGTDFSDRERAAGFRGNGGGENIARGQTSAAEVMADWMSSPGHRRNILDCQFTSIGVGYVANGRYWTQNFGY
jgi:uncharacterized protein YkwD